jgi:polyphosphate kinase
LKKIKQIWEQKKKIKAPMGDKNLRFINRDLSWLSFNARVLQEAADPNVPLLERLKFLGIYSNNQDEFFKVRVATLKRMGSIGKKAIEVVGDDPIKVLRQIQLTVIKQQRDFESIYNNILKELEKQKIYIINEQKLSKEQGKFVRNYFRQNVRPHLVPIMLDHVKEFPYLKDKAIYLLTRLNRKDKKNKNALVEIPSNVVSRFLVLPIQKEKTFIILLDDVIRYCMDEIFSVFEYDSAEAYTIKMTRDAEIDIDTDINSSLVEKLSKGLKKRKTGQPVRLIYDSAIAPELFELLIKKLKLKRDDNLIPGGRYHNFKDFMGFPKIGDSKLRYEILEPIIHKELANKNSLFDIIKKKDILLTFPYQRFDHIIDLLREAAIDPKVSTIKMTLYRVAKQSAIINALVNAARNGKNVTVLVELQARFDEEANIYWANKLQEEGVKVIFGLQGLKVHSKLFLIIRKEANKNVAYAHVGTGNFNEVTAHVYTDFSLLTADKRITSEVAKVFDLFSDNFKVGAYKSLLVSPFYMRKKFVSLINNEIKNAEKGKPAWIYIKLNSLSDEDMVKKLYEASRAGVKIKLLVRGICSLVPGVKGLSENIEAYSLVDRYLEHSRVFIFGNGGNELYFISSADWMVRNLDYRIEVACPVYDNKIQRVIKKIFEMQLSGNIKLRHINEQQDNTYRRAATEAPFRAQYEIYNYFKNKLNK